MVGGHLTTDGATLYVIRGEVKAHIGIKGVLRTSHLGILGHAGPVVKDWCGFQLASNYPFHKDGDVHRLGV